MKFDLNNPALLQVAGQAGKRHDYFYIKTLENSVNLTFGSSTKLGLFADSIEYKRFDTAEWKKLTSDTTIITSEGGGVFFRNPSKTVCEVGMGKRLFESSGKFEVGGDIISLLYPSVDLPDNALKNAFSELYIVSAANLKLSATVLSDSCYRYMFGECSHLTAAPELPATVLAESCYQEMFANCGVLAVAPELPATATDVNCYLAMFTGCHALTVAPTLPAEDLADGCYQEMFYNCTNLASITCLAEYIPLESTTADWVYGVSSSGTFIKSANMEDWPEGASGIPTGWTVQDYAG